MFEDALRVDNAQNSRQQHDQDVNRGLALLLLIAVSVLASSWLLSTPVYLDLEIAAQAFPVLFSAIMFFAITRIQNRYLNKIAFPFSFIIIFACWSYVIYLNASVPTMQDEANADIVSIQLSGMSDAMYYLGLCLLVILHQQHFKFAVYLSSICLIGLMSAILVFTSMDISTLIAILFILSSSIALAFISANTNLPQLVESPSIITDDFAHDDILPSEIEEQTIVPELAINTLPLNENTITHDWELILRELQGELKNIADVDALFKRMLVFLNGAMEFNAAAVGMLQDKSIKRIAVYGDDEFVHSQSLGWTSQRIRQVFSSREPILSQQQNLSGSGADVGETLHRMDVPVISNGKAVGLVTIFRETMVFDTHDVKLASSIVFHSMLALRQSRLQDEVKRLSSDKPSTHLTLYTREQFVQNVKPVLEKLGKPRECSMFIVDIDNLSDVLDKIGREASTLLYRTISRTIISELTERDLIGRYGNEGFIVLMDETDMNGAKAKAETIRKKIENIKVKYQEHVITSTVSIGLTIVSDPDEDLATLMRKADMGLFVAKENGCNTLKVSL